MVDSTYMSLQIQDLSKYVLAVKMAELNGKLQCKTSKNIKIIIYRLKTISRIQIAICMLWVQVSHTKVKYGMAMFQFSEEKKTLGSPKMVL